VNTAIPVLLQAVRERLAVPRTPLYVVYIDFTKAFDTIPRNHVLRSLDELGLSPGPLLRLIRSVLAENYVKLNDGLQLSNVITQNTGVLQGDTLSPMLFILSTISLINRLQTACPTTKLIMYADDLIVYAHSIEGVQAALNELDSWCQTSGLQVNASKSKAMKFRRGGPYKRTDNLLFQGSPIEFVHEYTYLGLIIPSNAKGFTNHIRSRCIKALRACYAIRNPRALSLKTALELFRLKVEPIAIYGIKYAWETLTLTSLEHLDSVKASFLKRTMSIARNSPNRLVYLLADTQQLTIDIMKSLSLPLTENMRKHVAILETKQINVEMDFFFTPGMNQNAWKESNSPMRHVTTRYSIHGFHHLICKTKRFHDADDIPAYVKCVVCLVLGRTTSWNARAEQDL